MGAETEAVTGAAIDETHDPARRSFVTGAEAGDFPIQNLPFGVFARNGEAARGGVAIGGWIVDLAALAASGLLEGEALLAAQAGAGDTLNALLALGAGPRRALRRRLFALLLEGSEHREAMGTVLRELAACALHLPCAIGDYTDFYVGLHHATRIGALFRPEAPLLPNYKHVPIGYHGRASTVRVSGWKVRRPHGQTRQPEQAPRFGPTARLDYELELGVWIGPGHTGDTPIPIGAAAQHIAGYCLLNDWSARDVQAWEYQPLGPFLSKNFCTTVSPWIVTVEALAPFRVAQAARPVGDPNPLPYLLDAADQTEGALNVGLEVLLRTETMRARGAAAHLLARSSARHMYWTPAQMVAHHASGGCTLRPGDLLGTGTLSGPERGSEGCLMEATRGGRNPITLPSGETRRFLEDADEVILRAEAVRAGFATIGFGQCQGTILPAQ